MYNNLLLMLDDSSFAAVIFLGACQHKRNMLSLKVSEMMVVLLERHIADSTAGRPCVRRTGPCTFCEIKRERQEAAAEAAILLESATETISETVSLTATVTVTLSMTCERRADRGAARAAAPS